MRGTGGDVRFARFLGFRALCTVPNCIPSAAGAGACGACVPDRRLEDFPQGVTQTYQFLRAKLVHKFGPSCVLDPKILRAEPFISIAEAFFCASVDIAYNIGQVGTGR